MDKNTLIASITNKINDNAFAVLQHDLIDRNDLSMDEKYTIIRNLDFSCIKKQLYEYFDKYYLRCPCCQQVWLRTQFQKQEAMRINANNNKTECVVHKYICPDGHEFME